MGTPISSFRYRRCCTLRKAWPHSTYRQSGISPPERAMVSTGKVFARPANSLPGALPATNSQFAGKTPFRLHNPVMLPYLEPVRCVAAAFRGGEGPRLNVHVSPGGFPALVLNADFRPLSYYPLSLWSWRDAIKAVFLERVNIVANYERAVHSPCF